MNSDKNLSSKDQKELEHLNSLRKCINQVLNLLQEFNDESIDRALLKILSFYHVDRVYIGIFDHKNHLMDFTHEVTNKGIVSKREDLLRKLPINDFPWWSEKIGNSESIIIPNTKTMDADAYKEQKLLLAQEIASTFCVPILLKDQVIGCLGLDSVKNIRNWSAFDLENLKIFADIIATSIESERILLQIGDTDQKLLMSEIKFRIVFEQLPLGVELYDENGTLLNVNDADTKIFGTKREEIIGINAFNNPAIDDAIRQSFLDGKESEFFIDYDFDRIKQAAYYKSRIKAGIKHLKIKVLSLKNSNDKIFGYIVLISDETEIINKNENLKYNLARLKVAVSTGNAFIWEYDVEKDTVRIDTFLSQKGTDSKNVEFIKNHQVLNLNDYLQTLHPEDKDMVTNNFYKIINGEINSYVADYRRILSGKLFWFHSIVNAFSYNSMGKPNRIISYTTDITEQRAQQDELLRIKEADKMKSAFLASMSHEIRTPLNSIVGFSDIVADTDDNDERKQYLNIIHQNTQLLLNLIDDILDFSKIEAGTFKYQLCKTNIKDICDELYMSNIIKMKPEVQLSYNKDLPAIFIQTDPQRIMQVIGNFINNAIKFTQQGYIKLEYKQFDNNLWIGVSDTGIGIADKDQERIFRRFVKVNDFAQGTGLGLAICKTIIETLGGCIGVKSKEGEGSTFWFTLPINKDI